MNGALAEKAGLKTWLGSKGNRTVFPSRWIERAHGVPGCAAGGQWRAGLAGLLAEWWGAPWMEPAGRQTCSRTLPILPRKQEGRVSALWEGVLYSAGITRNEAHQLPSRRTAEDEEKASSNLGGGVEDREEESPVWTSASTTPPPSVSGPGCPRLHREAEQLCNSRLTSWDASASTDPDCLCHSPPARVQGLHFRVPSPESFLQPEGEVGVWKPCLS